MSRCKRKRLQLKNEQRTDGILMHARAFTSTSLGNIWEYLDKLVCNSDCSRVTSSCQSSPMLCNSPDISAFTTFLYLLPWTNTVPFRQSIPYFAIAPAAYRFLMFFQYFFNAPSKSAVNCQPGCRWPAALRAHRALPNHPE